MGWAVTILAFIAIYGLGRKIRWAWLASALSYFIWAVDMGLKHDWAYVVAGVALGALAIYNLIRWRKS